jgi:hypothetical protein
MPSVSLSWKMYAIFWDKIRNCLFSCGALFIWVLALFYPLPGYTIFSKQNGILLHGKVKIKKEEGVQMSFV